MKKSILLFAMIPVLLTTGNLIGGVSGRVLILSALGIAIALLYIALRDMY